MGRRTLCSAAGGGAVGSKIGSCGKASLGTGGLRLFARELCSDLLDHRSDRGQLGAFFLQDGLEGPVVPPLVEVGCHQVQELFGPIQAPPQVVVLAGGAVKEGTEVVDGRALELLGREPAGPAVAGADPHDVDRAELADLAQLDDRQDQGVPDREAEEADQQQLPRPGCPLTTAAPAAPSERSTTVRGMNNGKALEL